jgi:hypothetical protein
MSYPWLPTARGQFPSHQAQSGISPLPPPPVYSILGSGF